MPSAVAKEVELEHCRVPEQLEESETMREIVISIQDVVWT